MKKTYTRTEYLKDQAFAGWLCLLLGFICGTVCTAGFAMAIAAEQESSTQFILGTIMALGGGACASFLALMIFLNHSYPGLPNIKSDARPSVESPS